MLVFNHDLVREAVYQELRRPVRAALHGDAAKFLLARGAFQMGGGYLTILVKLPSPLDVSYSRGPLSRPDDVGEDDRC